MHYLRQCLTVVCVLFCATALAQSQAPLASGQPPSSAGKIDLVAGDVRILQAGKQPRGAALGETVFEGDTLVTGKNSELHVTMQDTGFIALRPDTRIKIVSMKADGGSDDNAVISLVVGSLRSITGWIGRFNAKAYQVRTPTATIGIRGTDHETRYIPPGSPDGEPGTYDKVFAGGTSIQTSAGSADITPDHAGFGANNAGQAPQVLPRIPDFFRPGPHEDLINAKHAEIQKMIEQRREERRKVVAEKLAALTASREVLTAQSDKNKVDAEKRKAAADQQQRDTDAQYAALHDRQEALKKLQGVVLGARQKIREKIATGMSQHLRSQLNGVRDSGNALRAEWQALADAYKTGNDKNQADNDARKAEAEEQSRRTQVRLAEFTTQGKALLEKQKALQQRRDALQANSDNDRKAVRETGDVLDKEQKELISAQNQLFDNNIAASEARIHAGDQQRQQYAIQQAALNDREQALQQKQTVQEAKLMAIQEQAAKEQGQTDALRDPMQTVRDNLDAIHKERLQLLDVRRALRKKNIEAIDERQQEALAQLQAIKEKHLAMRDKIVDLQQERESMQEEIRMLYEQEQKRYRDELKADRQLNGNESAGE